ncbi:MAG: hypothetical protein ACRD88_18210 [Terriglobia bacterium]
MRFMLPLCLLALPGTAAAADAWSAPEIETGFRLLYELRFSDARSAFQSWRAENPNHPLGHATLAASYLFEEFHHHGVFSSEFFLDDKRLLGGITGQPDPGRRAEFLAANQRAQDLARQQLQKDARDSEALFALTMATGMMADYAGLIEKRHAATLQFVREADRHARELLAVKPDSADAYVSLGAANYVLGSLPLYKRIFLWLGGIRGDRERGMMQLEIASERGHYLRPFAKTLLALVALREKRTGLTRKLLEELTAEFPTNPVFRRELSLLNQKQ